jgi:hypothetical protein
MKPNKGDLEDCLYETHRQAAMRENASTQILKATYEVTKGNYKQAIVAAMMTFSDDGKHAPIRITRCMIEQCLNGMQAYAFVYDIRKPIPGFGSSFVKGMEDPLLLDLSQKLACYNLRYAEISRDIQSFLKKRGKDLYPNLAFYTAAATIELGININLCEAIMIEARLSAWNQILTEIENGKT